MPSPSVISFFGIPLKKDWESTPGAAVLKEKAPESFGRASVVHAYKGNPLDASAPPSVELIMGTSSSLRASLFSSQSA